MFYLSCDDCGKEDEDVYETTCPYAEEINGQMLEICVCPECYAERCYDV